MTDRRNPYLILGLDFGCSPEEASAGFARAARRLRQGGLHPFTMEDATWALHELEQVALDPSLNVETFRVPANPAAYEIDATEGLLAPAPVPLPRQTPASEYIVGELRADLLEGVFASALAPERIRTYLPPATPKSPRARAPEVGAAPAGNRRRRAAVRFGIGGAVAGASIVVLLLTSSDSSTPQQPAAPPTAVPTATAVPTTPPTPTPPPTATPAPALDLGLDQGFEIDVSNDGLVRFWQETLQDLGYTVRVDGIWGPATEAATRDFQSAVGLPATGQPNAETVAAAFAAVGG